MIYLSCGAVLC